MFKLRDFTIYAQNELISNLILAHVKILAHEILMSFIFYFIQIKKMS